MAAVGALKGVRAAVSSPGQLVLQGVHKALESRYEPSLAWASSRRARRPQASNRDLAVLAVRQVEKELATIGAATGATAAVPGAGTLAALSAIGVDIVASGARIAEMVLRVAAAYGEDLESIEERRAAVLTIILGGAGGAKAVEKVAGELGKGLGKKALSKVSGQQLRIINRVLGRTIITKYGTKRGAITLGRALPFGFGAAIGAGGNLMLARATGRYAIQFFDDDWSPADDVVVLEADGVDFEDEEADVVVEGPAA